MSYDPGDEQLESLLTDIVNAFDQCHPRLKKRIISGLLDEIALRGALLVKNKVPMSDESLGDYRKEHWGEVEEARIGLARKLLYSLMSEELP